MARAFASERTSIGAPGAAIRAPALRLAVAALALLTLVRLIVAAVLPLAPDEAYYWLWSRALQPGYYDHPAMVALWIRAGTSIAGATALGVRLLGPIAAAAGSVFLYRAARDLVPEAPNGALFAVALLNATLLFGVGAVVITPDTPLLFFWTLGLFAMGRVIATGEGAWWLLAGAAAGLALDSKYTAPLFLAAVGLWLLVTPLGRRWLRRPEPWLALALAFLLFAPTLAWNAEHHFVSFVKQGGRVEVWQPLHALRFEGELVLGQAGLFTPLLFVFGVWGTWRAAATALRTGGARPAFVALLTLLPAAVFVQHALGARVQGNWPGVLYPSAALAAAALAAPGWRRLRAPALALGFAVTALVYLQASLAPFALSARADPSLRELGGWRSFAARLEAKAIASGATFIATPNYGAAAELAFLARGPVPIAAIGPRWRFFRFPPVRAPEAAGLLVRPGAATRPPDPAVWRTLGPPEAIARTRKGRLARAYVVFRVRAREEVPAVLLPRRATPASHGAPSPAASPD